MTDTTDTVALREEVERLREELLVERNAAINLSNHLSDCAGKLRAANAEIAALKGDQVPVGYIHDHQLAALMGGNTTVVKPNSAFGETVELFTAPQKPFVWLGDIAIHVDLHEVGALVSYDDVVAAIEAAGGIVKDGE